MYFISTQASIIHHREYLWLSKRSGPIYVVYVILSLKIAWALKTLMEKKFRFFSVQFIWWLWFLSFPASELLAIKRNHHLDCNVECRKDVDTKTTDTGLVGTEIHLSWNNKWFSHLKWICSIEEFLNFPQENCVLARVHLPNIETHLKLIRIR